MSRGSSLTLRVEGDTSVLRRAGAHEVLERP